MSNEVRVTSSTGGQKGMKDERMDLIPPEALFELSRVYGKGSIKYADNNYRKGYDWSKSYASAQRHLNSFWSGEDLDPEFELSHLAHAAWHCFALYMFTLEHPDFDDRLSTIRRKAQEATSEPSPALDFLMNLDIDTSEETDYVEPVETDNSFVNLYTNSILSQENLPAPSKGIQYPTVWNSSITEENGFKPFEKKLVDFRDTQDDSDWIPTEEM